MSAMHKRQILWLAVLIQATISGFAQSTAMVNWTNVHQVIDGFGASDAFQGQGGGQGSTTSANQALLFGTGVGQLGYSILRVCVPSGASSPYCSVDCTSVGISCAGPYLGDMQAVVANGGRVFASPWTPPAQYTTNDSTSCSSNSGLASSGYAGYATWLANFVQSLSAQGVPLYGLSVQNEPNDCGNNLAYMSGSTIDSFIKNNLGPTFTSDGISTLIAMPETGTAYDAVPTFGGPCGTDPSCSNYVGIYAWQDYNAVLSGTNTVTPNPYPSGWASGKKYWQTEVSCPTSSNPAYIPSFCQSGYNPGIVNGLDWAAVIDQRIAGDDANAWLYWWLYFASPSDDEGLTDGNGNVAARGYVLAQYSKFVRPGYYRIDSTRQPQTGVSVSAYQNTGGGNLVIIATNYTGAAVSQTFNITNAPTFSTLTPTITSASQSLAQLSNVSLSGNSFTYTLPAQSIVTFVGSTASIPPPTNLSGTVVH
jgi:glucuronoarabinoxylan endo-1,4-beta-xylanase